jgi:hypothetical protein
VYLASRFAVGEDGNLLGSRLSDSRRGVLLLHIINRSDINRSRSNGNEGNPEGRVLDDGESRDPWCA